MPHLSLGEKMMNFHKNVTGSSTQRSLQGGLAASGIHIGKKFLSGAVRHPILLFGLGTLAGVYLYKKRHTLVERSEPQEEQPVELAEND